MLKETDKDPVIDRNEVIVLDPCWRVFGVYCENNRKRKFYEIIGIISTICGLIGILCLMLLFFGF